MSNLEQNYEHLLITEQLKADTLKALSNSKANIISKDKMTFLISLLLKLPVLITREIPTMAVDGQTMFVNPEFYMAASKDFRIFLLLHETLHVAYDHCNRAEQRCPEVWCKACDYVVNQDLKTLGLPLPSSALYDSKFKDLSVEQVYDLLIEESNQYHPQEGAVGIDVKINPTPTTAEEQEKAFAAKTNLEAMLMDAATQAQMSNDYDSVPNNIKRFLDNIRNPKLNWKVILKRFMFDFAKADSTWRRPNKRFLPYYLPSQETHRMGKVDFAIDVSGSISEETFYTFCSEVYAVLRLLKPKQIDLIQFDHAIQSVNRVRSIKDLLNTKFVGGGGTYLEPVMQLAIKSPARAMIILTDGYFSNNITNPNKPVIWCVYNNPQWQPPFGQVVHFEF